MSESEPSFIEKHPGVTLAGVIGAGLLAHKAGVFENFGLNMGASAEEQALIDAGGVNPMIP